MKFPPVGAELFRANRQTDGRGEANIRFRNYRTLLKIHTQILQRN